MQILKLSNTNNKTAVFPIFEKIKAKFENFSRELEMTKSDISYLKNKTKQISKNKKLMVEFNGISDRAEAKISELEYKSKEIIQNKVLRDNKITNKASQKIQLSLTCLTTVQQKRDNGEKEIFNAMKEEKNFKN